MKIYIASSFKNLNAVAALTILLQSAGHQVLDWSKLASPISADLTPEQRRAVLDSDLRGEIFDFCSSSCGSADLLIYLGPAGQDSACEVGVAYVAGVPTLGLAGPMEVPGLMLTRAVREWCDSMEALLERVEQLYSKLLDYEREEVGCA